MSLPRRVMVVGSGGQDGRLLTGLFRDEGADVYGITRTGEPNIFDADSVKTVVRGFGPSEIYYLAAVHHASESPELLSDLELESQSRRTHVEGLRNFLEAGLSMREKPRIFYASSSHIFGVPDQTLVDETSEFRPKSPYARTKVEGMQLCREYRSRHGSFASVGILFNHESLLRPRRFLSKKIICHVCEVQSGRPSVLEVGDLLAQVDWGFAPDYVQAMRQILALPEPDDFVIATGELHTVREFVEAAFSAVDLPWEKYVREADGVLFRRNHPVAGNSTRLRQKTGWRPTVPFREMVQGLVLGHLRTYSGEETHFASVVEKA